MPLPHLIQLVPVYHHRVWGGQQFKANPPMPIGEAWLVHEQNRVAYGPLRGRTLADVSMQHAEDLLGAATANKTGGRFPLLIKILDCADWLSVQVHPNNAQAVQLEGAGAMGKTEAWHVLTAAPGAQIPYGFQITPSQLPRVYTPAGADIFASGRPSCACA